MSDYLRPLLAHARDQIPPSLHKDTPIFLLATAGMRLLSPKKQAEILLETCRFLHRHSDFKIEGASDVGPCGSSVRIITGEEEGLFGWIAVNYLMDGFSGLSGDRTTYGFLDMGGASTQIAFEPSLEHITKSQAKNLIDVRLRLLGGDEIHHKVFVTTWLGYGTNQARERYVGKTISESETSPGQPADAYGHYIPDPCLPKDMELTEAPVHTHEPMDPHLQRSHRMVGTGSFEQCVKKTAPLLNTSEPCPNAPCLMNGVHVPPIDFSVSRFIGVSEYWYSSEHIFGLGGAYDFVEYERAASEFCSRPWKSIVKEHEESRMKHQLGGDGQVEKNGEVVAAGKWGPEVELPRLQMQCFKAAWIANVLHEGIKMPRIVDPGGNVTSANGENVAEQAAKKGLGRPSFQSMESVGDIAISWTLGKMVLEASKEVPSHGKPQKPLVDPIDDIEDITTSPIQPIRPPFWSIDGLEHRIGPHLPDSLSRNTLGFSPILLVLYILALLFLILCIVPNRRSIRSSCLRAVRKARRDGGYDLLEEGKYNRPPSPTTPSSSWLYTVRRIFSTGRPKPKLTMTTTASSHALRQYANGGARASPTRSFTAPTNFMSVPSASSTQLNLSLSRSSSPAPGSAGFPDEFGVGMPLGSLLSSRSRNGSQVSLATMTSRPTAISRANSETRSNLYG